MNVYMCDWLSGECGAKMPIIWSRNVRINSMILENQSTIFGCELQNDSKTGGIKKTRCFVRISWYEHFIDYLHPGWAREHSERASKRRKQNKNRNRKNGNGSENGKEWEQKAYNEQWLGGAREVANFFQDPMDSVDLVCYPISIWNYCILIETYSSILEIKQKKNHLEFKLSIPLVSTACHVDCSWNSQFFPIHYTL